MGDPIVLDKRKYRAGIKFVEDKDYEKGFLYFNAMISESPRSAMAWLYRGRCQEGLGNHFAALADYTKAGEIDYNVSDSFYFKARLLYQLEEYDQALEAANKAAWHQRNNAEVFTIRGKILVKLGMSGKAVMDFRKATSMGDENANYILRQEFNLQG